MSRFLAVCVLYLTCNPVCFGQEGCTVPGKCSSNDWEVQCMTTTDVTYQDGPTAAPSETWKAELQNGAGLGVNAVRCFCNNTDSPGPMDYERDGTYGKEYFTLVKYLTWNGNSVNCVCRKGKTIAVSLDPDACATGVERATGLFYLESNSNSDANSAATTVVGSWPLVGALTCVAAAFSPNV